VRIPIYELPSLRCGFYEVFSDKTKIIFNGYAMIDVQKFNFALFSRQCKLAGTLVPSHCSQKLELVLVECVHLIFLMQKSKLCYR